MKTWNVIRYDIYSPQGKIIGKLQSPSGKKALKEFERFCMFYRAGLSVPYPIKLGLQLEGQ